MPKEADKNKKSVKFEDPNKPEEKKEAAPKTTEAKKDSGKPPVQAAKTQPEKKNDAKPE